MKLKQHLMPHVAACLSSHTLKQIRRKAHGLGRSLRLREHRLDVFLKLDDPYSYLLVQVLESLRARFRVNICVYVVQTLPADMFPEPGMWATQAVDDARWLASLYGLVAPAQASDCENLRPVQAFLPALLDAERQRNLTAMVEVFHAYWQQGQPADTAASSINIDAGLRSNEARLRKLGHYASAMLYCEGEWYWGLDRLDHLERRLIEEGAARADEESVRFERTWMDDGQYSVQANSERPLVMYFSARSPYSYLGLEKAARLQGQLGVELIIKPVLPMVMRDMPVPDRKKMYIFLDTKREADKLGIPYGRVADPLGAGVERCYALFRYAESRGKGLDYLLSFARRVNAEGVRADTDAGMQQIVEAAGLDWSDAKPLLADASSANADWRVWARQNLDELYRHGQWGVPCFRYGDLCVWGQDRLRRIEHVIRNESSS